MADMARGETARGRRCSVILYLREQGGQGFTHEASGVGRVGAVLAVHLSKTPARGR